MVMIICFGTSENAQASFGAHIKSNYASPSSPIVNIETKIATIAVNDSTYDSGFFGKATLRVYLNVYDPSDNCVYGCTYGNGFWEREFTYGQELEFGTRYTPTRIGQYKIVGEVKNYDSTVSYNKVITYFTVQDAPIPATPVIEMSSDTIISGAQYKLIIKKPSDNYTQYNLQESQSSSFGNYNVDWFTADPGAGYIMRKTVSSSTKYYYRIYGYNEQTGKQSNYSNTVSITINPVPPPAPVCDPTTCDQSDKSIRSENYCGTGEVRSHDLYDDYGCSSGQCVYLSQAWRNDRSVKVCASGCDSATKDCVVVQPPPVSCIDECRSIEIGCNGTAEQWNCYQDSNGCWKKFYTTCSADQSCQVSSCVPNPTVTINYPVGGESFVNGSITIKWKTAGDGLRAWLDIEYSVDGGKIWTIALPGTPNDGEESWTIPNKINSSNCKIRVIAYDDTKRYVGDSGAFAINACYSNWQCGDWGICEYPRIGENIMKWVQQRECRDSNGCADSYFETRPCNCSYTSIEWLTPTETEDGETAYFEIKWVGDCRGDNLQIRTEEFTWANRKDQVIDITIDPLSLFDQSQIFSLLAHYIDAPGNKAKFMLVLARKPHFIDSGKISDIVSSKSSLLVIPWYSPGAASTIEEAIKLSRLPITCGQHGVTLTDECLRYWKDMGMSTWEERQWQRAWDIVDWIWKGSCVLCGGSLTGTAAAIVAAEVGGVVFLPITIPTAIVSCGICLPVPFLEERLVMSVTKMATESTLWLKVERLNQEGITATYKLLENGGYVTYVKEGIQTTEVYGISSAAKDSLTFYYKTSLPPKIIEDTNLIELHKKIILDLSKFQKANIDLRNPVQADRNWGALQAFAKDDLYTEANDFYLVKTGGKRGPIKTSITPLLRSSKYNAVWTMEDGRSHIVVTMEDKLITSVSRIPKPYVQTMRYSYFPHEIGHQADFELLSIFRDPNGKLYQFYWPKEGDNVYEARELFNDITNLYVFKTNNFKYTEYLDGIYAIVHEGGSGRFVDDTVQLALAGEKRINAVHTNYFMAQASDLALAVQLKGKLLDTMGQEWLDKFLVEQAVMERDAITLFTEMVVKPGLDASLEMDRILKKYGFVVWDKIAGTTLFAPGDKFKIESSLGLGPNMLVKRGDHMVITPILSPTNSRFSASWYAAAQRQEGGRIGGRVAPFIFHSSSPSLAVDIGSDWLGTVNINCIVIAAPDVDQASLTLTIVNEEVAVENSSHSSGGCSIVNVPSKSALPNFILFASLSLVGLYFLRRR